MLNLKTAKNDGSFASGPGPCLLVPLLREVQVLAENAETPSQLITFTNCKVLDLLVDSSRRCESSHVRAEVVLKVYVQVYWLFICRLVSTATAEEGRWLQMSVSSANWIVTVEGKVGLLSTFHWRSWFYFLESRSSFMVFLITLTQFLSYGRWRNQKCLLWSQARQKIFLLDFTVEDCRAEWALAELCSLLCCLLKHWFRINICC